MYFDWHSNCLQFTINLLLAKLLQMAFKLPVICNPLLFAYHFNWRSNCLQFTIKLAFSQTTSAGIYTPANLQSVALCLQLQLAYKLPAICNPLLFAYDFQCHSKARNLQSICSLPATITSLQMPAICNPLLFAYNYFWHSNCPQICNPFALCIQLPFRNSILGLASASCTMPPKGELWLFSDHMRTLSYHQLYLVRKTCSNLNAVAVLWSSTSVWECHFDYI